MTLQLSHEQAPVRIDDLLREGADYLSGQTQPGELLKFHIDKRLDVYNPSAPFEYEGRELIAGRTEVRDDETSSMTCFFWHDLVHDVWVYDDSLPSLNLQDPFVKKIHGQWVVGGVKVYPKTGNPKEADWWETHIYRGPDLRNLRLLGVGPYKMKDIRLVELQNGRIGIFTRPQGEKGGLGKIGFTTVQRLEEINTQVLQDAPIVPGLFSSEHNEWGGVNEAHLLEDGTIGVIGHIARFVAVGSEYPLREYYPLAFKFVPTTGVISDQQIIATRDWFPETASKRPDTKRVLFSAGIKMLGKSVVWYGGVSDTSVGTKEIPNPFVSSTESTET